MGRIGLRVLIVCVTSPLWASDLEFDSRNAVFSAAIEDLAQAISFPFTNTASGAVTVIGIRDSCACIKLVPGDKSTYLPGERGSLALMMDFVFLAGKQKKKVKVITRQAGAEADQIQELIVEGEIPTPLRFSASAAIWLATHKAESKEITVSIVDGRGADNPYWIEGLHVVNPAASPFFSLEVTQGKGAMTVRVKPSTTDPEVFSPGGKRVNVQQTYTVAYRLMPANVEKKERFYAFIAFPVEPTPSASTSGTK